ncbi:hypothetical protein [Streptomyces sp. AcE210]|uniref:hypothetical protein n=1 Tax=Streptomyces sp. AcE210 TaxID=2292703 RepID=UPI0014047C30|nr:hypothetical protein [Streptomyces sp. AcE210]
MNSPLRGALQEGHGVFVEVAYERVVDATVRGIVEGVPVDVREPPTVVAHPGDGPK